MWLLVNRPDRGKEIDATRHLLAVTAVPKTGALAERFQFQTTLPWSGGQLFPLLVTEPVPGFERHPVVRLFVLLLHRFAEPSRV